MEAAPKTAKRRYMTTAVATATMVAGLLVALAVTSRDAEAIFPGSNGRIAFASDRTTGEGVDNPEGDFEIFTTNRDGTGLTQLTDSSATDFDPEWSPNGRRIAFQSDRTGFSNIYVMNADGTGPVRLTDVPAGDFTPDWQPSKRRR
jgi:Tol biopolymer transport system component